MPQGASAAYKNVSDGYWQGSIVLPRQKSISLEKLNEKNISWNFYYAKNCYYLTVETAIGFGENESVSAYLLPLGFNCKANRKQNANFMLKTAIKESWGETAINSLEKRVQNVDEWTPLVGTTALWNAPIS